MRPLFVTHATRDDLLLGFLAHHQKKMSEQEGSISRPDDWAGAMILSVGASSAFPDVEDTTPEDREALPYLTQMAIDTDAPVVKKARSSEGSRSRRWTAPGLSARRFALSATPRRSSWATSSRRR